MFISHVSDKRLMDADAHYQLVLLHERPICALWGSSLRGTRAWHGHKLSLNRKCCTLYLTDWGGRKKKKVPDQISVCTQRKNGAFPWEFWLIIMSPSGIFSAGWVTLHLHKEHAALSLYGDIWYFGDRAVWTCAGLSPACHAWHHRVCF